MISREHVHGRSFLKVADRAGIPLPPAIVQARQRIERVAEHARKTAAMHHGENPRDVIETLVDEILAAADAGEVPSPDVFSAVDTVERKRRAADLSLEVAREAVDRSWRMLRAALAESRDEIVIGVRKALEETLDAVRAVAGDLDGLDLGYPETFAGIPKAGKAYSTLAAGTKRYVNVRDAQRQLWGGEPPDDELFLIENIADVWQGAGVGWRGHHQVKRKPWPVPVNSFAYVLWIATGIGGEGSVAPRAWIPTMEEYEVAAAALANPLLARVGPGSVLIGRS